MNRYNFNKVEYNDTKVPFNYYKMPNNSEIVLSNHPEIEEICHYISVSSSYRNTVNYPRHYDYRINLNETFYDVVKAEIIACTFPNSSGILDEPALIIDIDELNFIKCQNSLQTEAFTIVPLKGPNKASGGFINPELACTARSNWCRLDTPKGNLSSLTIKIRDLEGLLFDFGEPNGSTSKALQHSFVLKITTKVSKNNSSYLKNF